MDEMQLLIEWTDPMGARGEELRATWARLEMRVKGHALTRVLDHARTSVRDAIYLPLYPLAEWLATRWWFLLYEMEVPGRSVSGSYPARHEIRHGLEGFAFPPIALRTTGEHVRIEWWSGVQASARLEFLSVGSEVVSRSVFQEHVGGFIDAVVQRLEDQGVAGTLLQEEWSAIRSADDEEAAFCRAMASLGLDPYDSDEPDRERVLAAGAQLPEEVRDEFFQVVDSEDLETQAAIVADALEQGKRHPGELPGLRNLRRHMTGAPLPRGAPWRQGFEFAQRLRAEVGLNGGGVPDLARLATVLRTRADDLETAIARPGGIVNPALPAPFDAVVTVNERADPGFVVWSREETGRRFAFYRALFEYLSGSAVDARLVTRARTDRQKRNRAFAAQFLAPVEGIQQRLTGTVITEDEIEALAVEFAVSPFVIRHQIENHRLAQILPP